MNRLRLNGLNGANPLGFLAAVGLLRLVHSKGREETRLGFADDGTFSAWIECDTLPDLPGIIAADAEAASSAPPWRLEYEKVEKRGARRVADLKAPPPAFSSFLRLALEEWADGRTERADYAAAYATDVARDGNGNTKPTALHFTAANQQFLGTIEEIRAAVTREWAERTLHMPGQTQPGSNVRWDPDAERNRALMSEDPQKLDTVVNAPLEWLAFRGLPAFPCVPVGARVLTSCVTGRRQGEFKFHWLLWGVGATYPTVRSLLLQAAGAAEAASPARLAESRRRGVFAVCSSDIRRTAQGFGNFSPARVRA